MRVLVTGAGGVLGTRVLRLIESDRRFTDVAGLDVTAPRGRLRRTTFRAIDPRDRRRVIAFVREIEPTVVVHLGIYEPDARSSARTGYERTSANTIAVLGAAAELGSLESIVVRSGIEVYGRARGAVTVPDESVAPDPSSAFGHALVEVETLAVATGREVGVPVTALRFAPVVGPRYPSPLGRYLRLPVLAVDALADPAFCVLSAEDAARAAVGAIRARHDGPLNVVAEGAVSASQAALRAGHLPIPVAGPQWRIVRALAARAGAPLPEHVVELLRRGRAADGHLARSVLATAAPATTAIEALDDLASGPAPEPLRLLEGAA